MFWHDADEFVRTRVRRAWRLSLEQLRDGCSRWLKVRGPMRAVMYVFFDAGWFPLHPTNLKQAGGEGVCWSFTGVGDSVELVQVCRVTSFWCIGPVRRPTGMERVLRKGATCPSSSSICVFSRNVRTTPCMVRCSRQLRERVGRRLGWRRSRTSSATTLSTKFGPAV